MERAWARLEGRLQWTPGKGIKGVSGNDGSRHHSEPQLSSSVNGGSGGGSLQGGRQDEFTGFSA